MNLGLPKWSLSLVKDLTFRKSRAEKTHFHLKLFAFSRQDKASLFGDDGNSLSWSKNPRLWLFLAECRKWTSRYILPLLCYLLKYIYMVHLSDSKYMNFQWLFVLKQYKIIVTIVIKGKRKLLTLLLNRQVNMLS